MSTTELVPLSQLITRTIGHVLQGYSAGFIRQATAAHFPDTATEQPLAAIKPTEKYNNSPLVELLTKCHLSLAEEAQARQDRAKAEDKIRQVFMMGGYYAAGYSFDSFVNSFIHIPGMVNVPGMTDLHAEYQTANNAFTKLNTKNRDVPCLEYMIQYPETLLKKVNPELANPEHAEYADAIRMIMQSAAQSLPDEAFKAMKNKMSTLRDGHAKSISEAQKRHKTLSAPTSLMDKVVGFINEGFGFFKKLQTRQRLAAEEEKYILELSAKKQHISLIESVFEQESAARAAQKAADQQNGKQNGPRLVLTPAQQLAAADQQRAMAGA